MVTDPADHKAGCVDDEGRVVCVCDLRRTEDALAEHAASGFAMLAEAMR